MPPKVLSPQEIESIALSTIMQPSLVITNTGLSEELKRELSQDISTDAIVELVKIKIDDTWQNFSGNPTEAAGIDEDGRPIYKHVWSGEDWLYLPFQLTLNSSKASGEIIGGSITIQNFNKQLAEIFERHSEAIPISIYLVSLETGQLFVADEHRYLTTITNTGITITGEILPADILAEPLPTLTYNTYNFRR